MKKLTILFFLLCSILFAQSQTSLQENFELGLPSSAPNTETVYTLNSGSWKIKGAFVKLDNGSNRLAMNTAAYAISPAIDKPIAITFSHRGSGSGKVLTVEKSINGGASWSVIGTATVSSSSTYGQSSISVGEAGTKAVFLRFTCSSATIYIDNLQVESSTMGDEPSLQAGIELIKTTGTSAQLKLNAGNGEGRMLVYSHDSISNWFPVDGTNYNLPTLIDENVFGIISGDVDTVNVEGLTPGENYHFAVYEYAGAGSSTNYRINLPGRLTVRTLEIPGIVCNPTAINFGSVKTGTSIKRTLQISGRYFNSSEGNIHLISMGNFKISTESNTNFVQEIQLPYYSNTLASTTIYIQFEPTELINYQSILEISGGGSSTTVQLTGLGSNTDSKTYYISPMGNDTGDGSFDSPWYNLQKAVDAVLPGDTILVRGGIYYPSMMKDGTKTTVRLTNSGTAVKKITIKNYPEEWPVLNFRDQPKKVSVRGIQLDGDWWHIYGLHITQAGDNGIKLEGNHNRIERCTFSYNDDTGLQLGFGHVFSDTHPGISSNDGSYCSYNDVIDCDSYLNCDADNFGSDADGFACKMHNGRENRFIRCRAWDNADDAWDLFETDYPVYIIECWAWGSGRAENFGWVDATGSFQGNGNAIKMGGNGTGGSSKGKHEAWNSIAFNCNKTGSVKGFDQNNHSDGEKIVNCLAFGNGYDFMFDDAGPGREYYNNICFGNIEIATGASESNNAMLSTTDKAWTNAIRGFGYSDFTSLSEEDAKAPRAIDGSLPKKFGRLKSGSILIDKGLDLRAPFTAEFPFLIQSIFGNSRDLGPYELEEGEIKTGVQILMQIKSEFELNVKNHSSGSEIILCYSVDQSQAIAIELYDIQGKKQATIINQYAESNIEYQIPINTSNLKKGIYVCKLSSKKQSKTVKLRI